MELCINDNDSIIIYHLLHMFALNCIQPVDSDII